MLKKQSKKCCIYANRAERE
ncbi:MAG: hypothetical protein DSY33_02115 [Archaeoglobus sp.]|nr:MAG: hypothetical protein DSY33_02115 [Archaeoglobus sp.]